MFARNQWYVIGWSRDIGADLYSRMVCGESILVFRKEEGTLAAMRDACPHRLLPLSMGLREGDTIRCRYHGLVVDADGRTIEMPLKADRANAALCAAKYPIVERYGFAWVWIGDAEAADPALVPDFWMCAPPEWVVDGDTYHVRCDYRLLIDNLMALTHEAHVHATSIGQHELRDFPIDTRVEDGKVILQRWLADVPAPPAYEAAAKGGRVDRWQVCYFIAPSNVAIDVGVAPVEEGATLANHPVRSFVINAITPETETTSHYYWGASRNVDIENRARTAQTKAVQAAVFKEDIEILEAQQRSIETNRDLKMRNFSIDAGGVRARAIIRRLAGRASAEPAALLADENE